MFSKMLKSKSPNFKAGFILTSAILIITFTFYAYQIFFTPNLLIDADPEKEEAYLLIPHGANFKTVVDSLQKNHILNDILSFSLVAKLMKYQENVKPGRYKISGRTNNLTILKKLNRGDQDPLNVTINNVRTKKDLAERISGRLELSENEILKKLNDEKLAASFGLDTNSILVLFIPNTYEFFWTTSANELMERMHQEYKKFWNQDRRAKADSLGLKPKQVMILASIVEAETNQNGEKPTIAGVYVNRLKEGWPLQADPTVKFALQDFTIKRITTDHTKINSPYNTYKNSGLPPGPINLPSITSIEAILNHENHNYMFFVADLNNPGYHKFSKDYRSHVNSANKYRKSLDKRNIF